MQSQRLLLLFLLFTLSSGASVSLVSHEEGRLVIAVNSPVSRKGLTTLSFLQKEMGSQVVGPGGEVLPAEQIQFAADPSVRPHISVEAVGATPFDKDTPRVSDGCMDTLVATQLFTPYHHKKVKGVPLTAFYVTPINGSVLYEKLLVTVRYKAPIGTSLSSEAEKLFKNIVVNPKDIRRVHKKRRAICEAPRFSAGKALHFTVGGEAAVGSQSESDLEKCNGLYALSASELSYLGYNIPFTQLAIHASDRGISEKPGSIEQLPSGVLEVSYISDDKNGDGLLNGNDRLLFWGSSPHFWYWDEDDERWDFSFDIYDSKRHYWVTLDGGKVMESVPDMEGGVPVASGIKLRRTMETNSLTTPGDAFAGHSSRFWKWYTLTPSVRDKGHHLEVFNVDPQSPVAVRVAYNQFKADSLFVTIDGKREKATFDDSLSFWIEGSAQSDEITLSGSMNGNTRCIDISAFDTKYRRLLSMNSVSEPLHFYSDSGGLPYRYNVTSLPNEPVWVLKINESKNYCGLIDASVSNNVSFSDSGGLGNEYALIPESAIKSVTPSPFTFLTESGYIKRSVRGLTGRYDYVIITPSALEESANRFAEMKAQEGYAPLVLNRTDMEREFTGGSASPVAVRNALRLLRERCGDFSYVLLWGGGHYDYKQLTTSEPNYVFPYLDGDTTYEDFYVLLDSGETRSRGGADAMVGRMPATSVSEAENYLKKYEELLDPATESPWRNSVVMACDDGAQGVKGDSMGHATSNDLLYEILRKRRFDMDISAVNLFEFPYVGNLKPDARKCLLDKMNSGSGTINYFGHGAFTTISDEKLFDFADIQILNNRGKYFFFSFFSCAVGFFDMPDRGDIGSELVITPEKGAIATWASSRSSGNGPNVKASRRLYRALFGDSLKVGTIGEGAYAAKEGANNSTNRKYVLFGDPSYRPYKKRHVLSMDIKTTAGQKSEHFRIFDTMRVTLPIPAQFDSGVVSLVLQNPQRDGEKNKDGNQMSHLKNYTYSLPGEEVYRYEGKLGTGLFTYDCRVPRSITQDTTGITLRVNFEKDGAVGSAVNEMLRISGVNLAAVDTTDKVGPMIKSRIRYRESDTLSYFADCGGELIIDGFQEKSVTIEDGDSLLTTHYSSVTLEIELQDRSGINHYYESPGENITLAIEGILPMTSLNKQYQPVNEDSLGRIPVVINRDQIPGKGEYEVTIQATDLLGNRSVEKYTLVVKSMGEEQYEMGQLFCYPCPVSRQKRTRFWFNQFTRSVERARLNIYTLDGRLIRAVNDVASGFEWDLRDQKGNLLSPNVYLYKLFVEVHENGGDFSSEQKRIIESPIKKITILP